MHCLLFSFLDLIARKSPPFAYRALIVALTGHPLVIGEDSRDFWGNHVQLEVAGSILNYRTYGATTV